jgi:tetratricopeptide (TPR) repeat protein
MGLFTGTDQSSTARDITADHGGVVVNGNVGGSVGLTPVQLKELMIEYARQDSAAVQQVTVLSEQLGVTKGALGGFFQTLEQHEVPLDQLATRLSEIARDHKKLLAEVASFRGEDDPDIASLSTAAETALRDGRNEEARSLLTQAKTANIAAADRLNSVMNKHKRRAVEKAAALGALANTEIDYRSAAASFAEAAALCPTDDALLRADYLNSAGLAEYRAGRYPAAVVFLGDALTIREKALGPDHPDTATSLNNLAALYRVQGQYDAAAPLYSSALAIREKALGPDHPDTAISLNNLAGLYDAQGRYDAAAPLYSSALAITEKALGPDHPNTATSLNNLAALYQAQGQYDAAAPLYSSALAITEKALGPNHSTTIIILKNLAGLRQAQGQSEEAEALFAEAKAREERAASQAAAKPAPP